MTRVSSSALLCVLRWKSYAMSLSNDLAHWIKLFLVAVVTTAENGKRTFERILTIRNEAEKRLWGMGRRAKNSQKLLALLYRHPIVNAATVADELRISQVTADELLKIFIREKIVVETTGLRRNRLFRFREYADLFGK